MTENSKYDALGELFHRKLEHHQISVDNNGWNEIEQRLNKSKNKAVIWLWLSGAAAAVTAALLIINLPTANETTAVVASQQIIPEETGIANHEATLIAPVQETTNIDVVMLAGATAKNNVQNPSKDNNVQEQNTTDNQGVIQLLPSTDSQVRFDDSAVAENNQELPTEEYKPLETTPESEIPKLNIWLTEEETVAKRDKKWLFAAAFGMGGAESLQNTQESPIAGNVSVAKESDSKGFYNNSYAAEMSYNVRSFDYLSKNDFNNVNHNLPLSFGLTARKSLGKKGGVETGLVYTNLESRFEWSEWGTTYDARQTLHYVGVPVNLVIYILDTSPNWRIYLSGGFAVEKGLRATYRQKSQWRNQNQTTTVKKSSIDGLQWSLNSALGVNYKIEKGWGIYFEPRVGYSFDCNQPASIRTESPVYFGINLGLNYEL